MKVDGIDVDYYEQHDFGKDFKEAEKEGRVFWLRGCTIENVMDKIREQRGIAKDNQTEYKP